MEGAGRGGEEEKEKGSGRKRRRGRTLSRIYAWRDFAWASAGNYDARNSR